VWIHPTYLKTAERIKVGCLNTCIVIVCVLAPQNSLSEDVACRLMIILNRALPGNFRRCHLRNQIATDTSSWASTYKCNGKCARENSSKPLCKRTPTYGTPTYAHKWVTSNHGMPDWSTRPALHSFQNTEQTHPFLKGVRRGSDISVLGVPGALPVSPSIPRAVSGRILPCHLTNRVIYEEKETEWQRQDWDCGEGHTGAHRQTLNTYTHLA